MIFTSALNFKYFSRNFNLLLLLFVSSKEKCLIIEKVESVIKNRVLCKEFFQIHFLPKISCSCISNGVTIWQQHSEIFWWMYPFVSNSVFCFCTLHMASMSHQLNVGSIKEKLMTNSIFISTKNFRRLSHKLWIPNNQPLKKIIINYQILLHSFVDVS